MNNFNIILFLCNWGPHAAFQKLQDQKADIPNEIKMIRIPCTGRISKALLFKAFEMGADGVALVGCSPGACRYGQGTDIAVTNIEDTRNIIEILGLGKERVRHATFLPDEPEALLKFLNNFSNDIKTIGKTPVKVKPKAEPAEAVRVTLIDIISKHDVYACQDCGKCSSACPLTLAGKPFSPRALASAVISGNINANTVKEDIWACLTCGLCFDRCPSAVNFPEFVRDLRRHLKSINQDVSETHGGFFHSLMRTMTSPDIKTNKWKWVPDDISLDQKSKILFFGGCATYFDAFFRNHLGVQTTGALKDSLYLLNFFDIKPALLEHERCCGHDLLWSGDFDNFLKLAELNLDAISRMDIEKVITACPECFRTLSYDYPNHGLKLDFEVIHIYNFLETEIGKGGVAFKDIKKSATYQDSCRLSRFDDRADLPRKLIKRLNNGNFNEMSESGRSAICCGNSAWVGCDSFSKALQVKRLKQAKSNGSNLIITSCPKCQVHLKCAMEDPFLGNEIKVDIEDLTSAIAKNIYWK